MDPRTQERVEQWDSRPFSGGYDGLSDLADSDFSGAVTVSGTWLFMLNGRIVGVVDGAIEEFETATGTAYEAPDPALPLLCTMEERGGETRGKYYTNETPLREVDATLQEGSFTGYVELSENVLSGDYYAVYYGGRRMAAAYIGNAERLLTGDGAFDRADDEVGIYTVVDVDIDVTDVPGTGAGAGAKASDEAGAAATATETEPAAGADADPSTDPDPSSIAFDAGANADPEPSADSPASSIDSIDLSGTGIDVDTASADESSTASPIEDVEIDAGADASELEDLASSEPSGITATDETEPQPASSGITDAGATADATSNANTDVNAVSDASESAVTDEIDLETETIDPSVDDSPIEDVSRSASSAPDLAAEAETESADESSTDDADGLGGTSPDLAEVEAAAEQLDRNDISWTEEDVKSTSDDESSSDDAGAAIADGATTQPIDESEPAEDEQTDERFEQEAQWRETRSIPSIDPDNSASSASSASKRPSNAGSPGRTESGARETGDAADSSRRQSQAGTSARGATQTERADAGAGSAAGTGSSTSASAEASSSSAEQSRNRTTPQDDQRVAALTEQLETLEEQRDALLAKAEQLETERDQLRSENEELSSTVDRLQSRIQQLESELERARESGDDGASTSTTAGTRLSPQQALAETNLFVRYGSKSQPTLESAHGGEGDQSEVASNLRLEHHTGFDAADAVVDGEPYESFLTESMKYRFVDWLTGTVLFEVRDTGNADALGDLYDAIPRIDRAELDATISLADDETEDVPDQVGFDVVAFDKMGNPLLVANLNDSREPASQGMLEDLEAAASAVKANYPSLAAATVVTSSYFEPGALEVTEQATGGGFLSRGSKLSYVSLSRKQGYHLCLVESRSEGFHMNVPEL